MREVVGREFGHGRCVGLSPACGKGAFHQPEHAVPHHCGDVRLCQGGNPARRQQPIHRRGEVREGMHQGAVEVEQKSTYHSVVLRNAN